MRAAIIAILLSFSIPAVAAETVSVSELDANSETWDGRTVTIVGEVVGDYSFRDEELWVQLNDDPYVQSPVIETGSLAGGNIGIGVRMPSSSFSEDWGPPGGYHERGPVLEVTGVFRYADPETGGDTFVDASAVELIEAARPIEPPPAETGLLVASGIMIAAGAAMWARARWRLLNPKP